MVEGDFKFEESKSSDINLKSTITKEDYIKQVNKLKEHIQAGDIYEINFCISFESENAVINPFSIYDKLNEISLAPYSALVKFDNKWIISSSPELYIEKKDTKLTTKPIKGTTKRGKNKEEDLLLKLQLQQNHKERTENVMIVDVCRNDLSKFAKKGSVHVPKLYAIETYEQVHQMVSTIECQVDENTDSKCIIDATFPMASMTGAPKIKAMELADDYETNNRNAYSGSLGYIKQSGDFTFNVLIRSIFYDERTKYLSFSVGSAITILSDAEAEYEECLLKAKAMATVLGLKI